MAHYAFLNNKNIVTEVISGIDETDTSTLPDGFASWEDWYGDFRGQTCKRTSYNTFANEHKLDGTPFRGNYAGKGYVYDETNDVFYLQKPFPSWTLNETTWLWEAPVALPDLENDYFWNEREQSWELIVE